MHRRTQLTATLPLLILLCACAGQPEIPTGATGSPTVASAAEDANATLVRQAAAFIGAKKPAQALALAQQAIAGYEKKFRQDAVLSYSARSLAETLWYASEGAKTQTSARVQGPEWGLAYFLAGYALVDLHRIPEAKQAFDAAIRLSPRNSQYLSERAQIDALEHDWHASFDEFKTALEAAEITPPESKTAETTRALRGMAFAQVELGDFEAAKALHARVLGLDPGNTVSKNELRYIQTQIQRRGRVTASPVAAPPPASPMPAPAEPRVTR